MTAPKGCQARSMPPSTDPYLAWEWSSEDDMQLRLAGTQSREEYLRDRLYRAGWVAERLGLTSDSRVFEIGSGEGIMAAALAPKVKEILCTDISTSFLEQARITCKEHLNVLYHHIENDYLETLPTASFDAGFSFNVFIHLDIFEIYHYFQQIARILKPGRKFTFNFLDFGAATRPFFHQDAARYRDAHPLALKGFMTYYGVELMGKVAAEAGLTPLMEEFVDENGVGFLVLRRGARPGV